MIVFGSVLVSHLTAHDEVARQSSAYRALLGASRRAQWLDRLPGYFRIMLVDAVRTKSDHFGIFTCFLERCATVRAVGDSFPGLQPNARDKDELTHRVVRPVLPGAEVHTCTVRFGPSNVRNNPYTFAAASQVSKVHSRCSARLRRADRKVSGPHELLPAT